MGFFSVDMINSMFRHLGSSFLIPDICRNKKAFSLEFAGRRTCLRFKEMYMMRRYFRFKLWWAATQAHPEKLYLMNWYDNESFKTSINQFNQFKKCKRFWSHLIQVKSTLFFIPSFLCLVACLSSCVQRHFCPLALTPEMNSHQTNSQFWAVN